MNEIRAVSLDFADTLYPHRPREMERILGKVAEYLREHLPPFELTAFHDKFVEIREAQFAQNRATLRENDFHARFDQTIAFLNAAAEVATDTDEATAPELIRGAVDAYAEAFVRVMEMPPFLPELLESLAEQYALCVVSNYPLTTPIVRTLERDGLLPHLSGGVVVSADIGFIKPHPAIFAAALENLGSPPPQSVVHVGDDWEADILGASRAGMRCVYTRQWRDVPDKRYGMGDAEPLAEINDLRALPDILRP